MINALVNPKTGNKVATSERLPHLPIPPAGHLVTHLGGAPMRSLISGTSPDVTI